MIRSSYSITRPKNPPPGKLFPQSPCLLAVWEIIGNVKLLVNYIPDLHTYVVTLFQLCETVELFDTYIPMGGYDM